MESAPSIITTENFQGLYSRYNFTQAEKGSKAVFDQLVKEQIAKMTKQGMLQAEHEGHSGLNRHHAQTAVELTPEIPKGIY